jgi:signal transduction histidine kinase
VFGRQNLNMQPNAAGKLGWTTLALAVAVAGVAMTLNVLQENATDIAESAFLLVAFVSLGAVGVLVISRVPRNAVGWLFLSCASLAAVTFLSDEFAKWTLVTHPGHLPAGRWAAWVSNWSWLLFLIPFLIFVPLLFPDGRLASRRWRPVAWVAAVALGLALLSIALEPGKPADSSFDAVNPVGIEGAKTLLSVVSGAALLALLVCLILAVISLVQRYRRAAGEERVRLKWFVYGVSILIGTFVLNLFGGDAPWTRVTFDLGIVAVPIGAGIAILRHRLYDIDVVINRTIVVGALAVFVTVVYAALVVGIGAAVVGSRSNTFLTLLAAVVIAVAFQPVRTRAQHFANRLVFGKRATPYEVLSEFADRVGRGYAGDDLLQQMAKTVGEGVGGSAAYVWLRVGSELQAAGAWPNDAPDLPTVPLADAEVSTIPGAHGVYPVRHEGELLGALSVSTSRGERMSQTEDKLVADLAAQAGLVLRNVRLIEELRASRQRIVSASDAERRRLERNIHDGAQQQLVALAMKLRLAKELARRDLDRAEVLLEDVQGDAQDALDTLRDLARGIYPPLLADEGLAAALSAQARRAAIPVTVEVDGIGRYPQDVEAAAYFCCLEAMQNAAKYGGGAPVTISLGDAAGTLTFRVADTGSGFDPAGTKLGSGLQNMQDRLEALGGSLEIDARPSEGTVVLGRIPVRSG